MSKTILDNFSKVPELNTPITSETIQMLEQYCIYFETKNEHPLALNTALLGVNPIYFLNTDRDILFHVLGISERKMKEVISETSYIDTNMKVTSDTYNNLIIWTAHRVLIDTSLTADEKEKGLFSLFKMLHYKFFTSIVNHSYKHGANKAIMEATIRKLSNKFDIITLGTWRRVIEERSKDVYNKNSIHYNTLLNYNDDKKILYILSDIQSRIRHKIVLVNQEYYKNWEEGEGIDSYDNIGTDKNGEKVITATSNVYDLMIAGLLAQIQSPARFIDNELIRALCNIFTYIREDAFRRILITFTQKAALQAASNDLEKVDKGMTNEDIYIGCNILIREMIQKSYRYCILQKVDMSNKNAILKQCKNLYASSRVTNEDIIMIKRSVTEFVLACNESKRDATNASIAIAFILYIIIRTFTYL